MPWHTRLKKSQAGVVVLAVLMMTSCGFHLRGVADIPQWLNKIAIIVEEGHHDLAPLLKERLKAYRVQVCDDPGLANYWLIISHDNTEKRIMSVSSSTTPRQYQLVYTVQFRLQSTQSGEVIPVTQIAVTRQLTVNSDRILGSNDEEERLKNEMRRDAVIQILDSLSRKTSFLPHQREGQTKPMNTQHAH